MKKQVTDIQSIHVELDDDDRELMAMFRSRQRIMNDVLLVQDSNEMYIVSKAELARQRKMAQDVLDFCTTAIAVFVILLQTILMVKRVVNPLRCLPWMSVVITVYMVTRFVVRKYRKMKAPCKDRKVTDDYNCHTHCEKYLAYQAYREALNADKAKKYALEPKRRRYR